MRIHTSRPVAMASWELPDAEEMRHRRVLAVKISEFGSEASLPVAYKKIRPVLHEHADHQDARNDPAAA